MYITTSVLLRTLPHFANTALVWRILKKVEIAKTGSKYQLWATKVSSVKEPLNFNLPLSLFSYSLSQIYPKYVCNSTFCIRLRISKITRSKLQQRVSKRPQQQFPEIWHLRNNNSKVVTRNITSRSPTRQTVILWRERDLNSGENRNKNGGWLVQLLLP